MFESGEDQLTYSDVEHAWRLRLLALGYFSEGVELQPSGSTFT
jgi:hypothetical protein